MIKISEALISYLKSLVLSIPDDLIKHYIYSFGGGLLGRIYAIIKYKFKNKKDEGKVRNKDKKENKNILQFIDSPDYSYKGIYIEQSISITSTDDSNNSIILCIILMISILSLVSKFSSIIAKFLRWYGLIPIAFAMIFMITTSISLRIHKITVKFIIFATISSILTLYFAETFEDIASEFVWDISRMDLVANSVIKLLGIYISLLLQFVSYELLIRCVAVYIDSKINRRSQIVTKYIRNTSNLESFWRLFIFLVISIAVSIYMTQFVYIFN